MRKKDLWRRQLGPVVLSPDFTLTFSGELEKITDIGILESGDGAKALIYFRISTGDSSALQG